MGGTSSCCSCEDDTHALPDESKRPRRQSRPRRTGEFTISVDRTTGEGLGVDATPDQNMGNLEVKNIAPGGLVDRWNRSQGEHSKLVVKRGMRVVEVNGRFGSPKVLIAACRETEVLRITFMPADAS
mmetsp:Transcript_127946/g.370262  ORF Transcript_127946/g.370262 Transcript_127946/m.370262 type:complete len:127 (-) Transcript_127946:93-473(-)